MSVLQYRIYVTSRVIYILNLNMVRLIETDAPLTGLMTIIKYGTCLERIRNNTLSSLKSLKIGTAIT